MWASPSIGVWVSQCVSDFIESSWISLSNDILIKSFSYIIPYNSYAAFFYIKDFSSYAVTQSQYVSESFGLWVSNSVCESVNWQSVCEWVSQCASESVNVLVSQLVLEWVSLGVSVPVNTWVSLSMCEWAVSMWVCQSVSEWVSQCVNESVSGRASYSVCECIS